jgi:hypothetical protein
MIYEDIKGLGSRAAYHSYLYDDNQKYHGTYEFFMEHVYKTYGEKYLATLNQLSKEVLC